MPRKRSSPAVRFLWIVAGLTVLFVAAVLAYRIFEADLVRWAMVPRSDYVETPLPEGLDYGDREMWVARPDIENHPGLFVPPNMEAAAEPAASVFYVHPTTFLDNSAWNGRIEDPESRDRTGKFVRAQASAFNHVGAIWAPRYRQAAFGAFLSTGENPRRAFDLAYGDVLAAYEHFIRSAPADRPIILAGHSQGALHLIRLLRERVAEAPEAERIAAAYLVGWPISETADLPFLPLPACERPDQSACILSWQSFAEPADPKQVTDAFDAGAGPTGISRAGSPMLCVNPLTGTRNGEAPASANLGSLVPNDGFEQLALVRAIVPARCDLRGLLLIGEFERLPEMGPYVLPGNNFHVYDFTLFWANVRADAARRLEAFSAGTPPGR